MATANDTQVGGDHYKLWLRYERGRLFWTKKASSKAMPGYEAGWLDKDGYIVVTVAGRKTRAARIVWAMHFGGVPDGCHVDHINGDVADNRIENLRLATASQNACNRGTQANNTTGVKGCVFTKGKYQAQIQVARKYRYLGRFNSLSEAKDVYEKAAAELHGTFRRG